ncbi:excinuclease ABC subunit C [archaeon]|nr:excinuclease ABC subunit C [archaeon]|tara:strand:+ start:2469 stop:4088 length:1620 start_codon:yes stop_codon:yes gene_type:complete
MLQEQLTNLPKDPGVYLFKDKNNNIIYIGKAKNLRNRVRSYFQESNKKTHSAKTIVLVKNITDLQTIVVNTEVEALLLENKLIKQHKPKYNITLKDAKSYAYIKLTTNEKFPRILSTRIIKKDGTYFGPFTDGSARRELIQLCLKIFKLRTCKNLPKRACLNYHINLCKGPCIKKITEREYQEQVKQAIQFLKGNSKVIEKQLQRDMKTAAENLNFELALEKRKQLEAIQYMEAKQAVDRIVRYNQDVVAMLEQKNKTAIIVFSIHKGVISGKKEYKFDNDPELLEDFIKLYYSKNSIPSEIIINRKAWNNKSDKKALEGYLTRLKGSKVEFIIPQRGDKVKLIEIAEKNAHYLLENKILQELQDKLNLPELPQTIECFDISNLGDEHIVAGMTQFKDGKANKTAYRKFEIQSTLGKQDDFAAMREVVYRRYHRLQKENKEMPELIIIDGGKGQVTASMKALKQLNLQIPLIGLAKQDEEIVLPNSNDTLKFKKTSPMMLLIRKIRDATHTLVINYNRQKRKIKMRKEALQLNLPQGNN